MPYLTEFKGRSAGANDRSVSSLSFFLKILHYPVQKYLILVSMYAGCEY